MTCVNALGVPWQFCGALVVLRVDLEEALRVVAHWAYLWSVLAYHDVSAVAALPDALIVAREHDAALKVANELLVTLLVVLLDFTNHAELRGNLIEALFLCLFCHACVHVCPLEVLASCSGLKVALGVLYVTALKILEPELCVLLLVGSCLLEDGSYLLIAFLAGFACEISVFITSLALTCESLLQILLGLCSFKILHNVLVLMCFCISPFYVCKVRKNINSFQIFSRLFCNYYNVSACLWLDCHAVHGPCVLIMLRSESDSATVIKRFCHCHKNGSSGIWSDGIKSKEG